MSERWLPIEGCDGYEVSDHGRVRSWWARHGIGHRFSGGVVMVKSQSPRIIKVSYAGRYKKVVIGIGKQRVTKTVHGLVASAFHGPAPLGAVCRHLDGNAENNRADNLAWGSHAENEADKVRHGTAVKAKGSNHGNSKLLEGDVRVIRMLLAVGGISQREIADSFGVDQSAISNIKTGRNWSHLV